MWLFKKKTKECKYASIILSLDQINIEIVKRAYSSEYSLIAIPSIAPSINQYVILLDLVLNAFKSDTLLHFSIINQEVAMVSLSNFYLNKGSYIDTVELTKEFICKAKEFINLYKTLEQADKTFVIEKNLCITAVIVNNIPVLAASISG